MWAAWRSSGYRGRNGSGDRIRQSLALLGVLLLLSTILGQVVHAISVPHQWCSVHGEFTDAPHGELAPSDMIPSFGRVPAVVLTSEPFGDHEHGHCWLSSAQSRTQSMPAGGNEALVLPALAQAVVGGCVSRSSIHPVRLLLEAPKTSPPRSELTRA
jgi:hypothetical protein